MVAYGHWGRPVLAFPAEGGSAWDFEHQGMVGAVGDLIEGGRVKLYCVDAFDAESWSNQGLPLEERARNHERYESWIVEQVVPHIQDGRARARHRHARRQPRRLPRRQLRAQARRPVPARRSASPATTTPRAGTAGASAARPPTSTTRSTTSSTWAATTSTGCASASASCSSAGRASGRTRPARSRAPSASRGLLGSKGIRHELDLWGHDVPHDWPSWRTPTRASSATVLLMPDDARHLIGLLLGTEEDWPRAFETLLSRIGPIKDASGHDPHGHQRADHDGAVRPARQAALRPRRRPARLLVLPPARVAEEGRADGRRVPAQQPVHVPVDGEARGLLRDAAARAEGAADRPRPAQEPARQRALRVHGGEVQPALRPRRDRRGHRLPAVHEALRRRPVDRRLPHQGLGAAAPRLRRVRPAADAPAGERRGLRRLRPLALHRRRDDDHALPPRRADARPLRRRPRLPQPRARRRGARRSRA